jgi:peptidase E
MRKIILTSNGRIPLDSSSDPILEIYKSSKKTLIVPGFSNRDEDIIKKIASKIKNPVIFSENQLKDDLKDIDCVVLCAGKPDRLLHFIKDSKLNNFLTYSDAHIIAFSAGSLVLGEKCVITPDDNYPELIVLKGLGLLPFSIEVHYDPKIDNILLDLSKITKIYAIPDDSALVYTSKLKSLGTVYYFMNGEKSVIK